MIMLSDKRPKNYPKRRLGTRLRLDSSRCRKVVTRHRGEFLTRPYGRSSLDVRREAYDTLPTKAALQARTEP